MSGLDVAVAVLPYQRLAGRPFTLEWAQAVDDGSEYGTPDDLSDVSDCRVTAELIAARGATPPSATVWELGAAVSLGTVTQPNSVAYQTVIVAEPTGLPAGTYAIKGSFVRGGATDWFVQAVLELTEQP